VSDGGRTYIVHLKRGIYFTPDPAFKGKRRELDARRLRLLVQAVRRSEERSPWDS
jgi:hypothetical protein